MNFIDFISVIILFLFFLLFAYLLDYFRMRKLIKRYNKRHPDYKLDVKKIDLEYSTRHYMDWYLSMFCKNESGECYWEYYFKNAENKEGKCEK